MKHQPLNPASQLTGKNRVPCAGRSGHVTRAIVSAAVLGLSANLASAQNIGPSTTVDPYLLPTNGQVMTTSVLTVGDLNADNGYRMVGIPDGMGAFALNGDLKLLMNHELGSNVGISRAHGSKGAFVSQWRIKRDETDLKVIAGEDHAQTAMDVYTYDNVLKTWVAGTTAFHRLCSADLPAVGAFHFSGKDTANGNRRINLGTEERIFLNGEENDDPAGRAFAHIASGAHEGESWELPRLGKMAFENVVASPYAQQNTVVMLMDDASSSTAPVATNYPSDLYIYIGKKQNAGHPIERAGLTNGKMYGIKVIGFDKKLIPAESNDFGLGDGQLATSARFDLVQLGKGGDVSGLSGLQLQEEAINKNVFRMQRIEDGAWDPRREHGNDFYMVTTASFSSNSRLWRLRFDDIEHPEKGGTIEILLKGNEGQKMLDNIGMDSHGRLIMQEDPGGNDYLAKVWLYNVDNGNLVQIAEHNPKFFDPSCVVDCDFLTNNEESSGVFDAEELLGRGWFFANVQAHTSAGEVELVEKGQLLAIWVDPALENNDNGIIP